MSYVHLIVSANSDNPVIHVHEVAALNKPGRIVDVLVGARAKKYLADFEREIEEAKLLEKSTGNVP
jgi:hypothetical protein